MQTNAIEFDHADGQNDSDHESFEHHNDEPSDRDSESDKQVKMEQTISQSRITK